MKQTNSQRRDTYAQILRRMWAGQSPPDTNPRTPDKRTTRSIARTDGATSRHNKNEPGMPLKILLSWISEKN